MVVGGDYIATRGVFRSEIVLDKVDVISLDDRPVPNCLRNLNPFPTIISHAAGASLKGEIGTKFESGYITQGPLH